MASPSSSSSTSSPTPSSSTSSSAPSNAWSSNSADNYTPTEWTQHSMMSDLMQQKGLLIGVAAVIVAFLFFRSRSRPEEKAARRLVRDFRHVDDPDDARDVLSDNLPTIVRPALLIVLDELQRQVHDGFRRIEKEIEGL